MKPRCLRPPFVNLVHYFSPFGSTAWIPAWQAETYLEQDDHRWSRLEELEMVSDTQRAAGPPRIEHDTRY